MSYLTDVCSIQYGYPFDSALFNNKDGTPLVRIRDVIPGFSNTYTTEKCDECYYVEKDDMLIGMDGEFNIAYWKGGHAYLNQRVCKIIPKEGVHKRYLFYQLMPILKRIENRTAFVTVKHLSAKELNKIEFSLPDLPTQQRIADTLDKVSEGIEVCRRMLDELELMVKAKFGEMFGDMLLNSKHWSECTLESLADIVSGITKGRKTKDENLIEVPYMAVSNVKDGHIDWRTVKTIMATTQEINQYRLQSDDVLMTEGGDPDKVGRGAIIKNPPENCIHQNHIFRVRLNEKVILPTFFAEYLQHQKAKRYFLGCAKQTTGIASINMRQLKAMPVLLPPIELQEQFATFVSKIDKSKLTIQQVLSKMEMVKLALMQEYFG